MGPTPFALDCMHPQGISSLALPAEMQALPCPLEPGSNTKLNGNAIPSMLNTQLSTLLERLGYLGFPF